MRLIISASRRTDIPAFFSDWFYNRLAEGHLLVRNPMNHHQISRVDLSPRVVDCIVFWSKNPSKMIDSLYRLENYVFYFQYTITGYGKILEPNVPLFDEAATTFRNLSDQIGKDRVIWRYDPIILTDQLGIKFHAQNFERIAERLSQKTRRCVISFVDMYKKSKKNMASFSVREIGEQQMIELALTLSKIASKYQIELTSCAESIDLSNIGIHHGKCIDDKLIEEISGFTLNIQKDQTQRAECGCVASIDVGAYNTCAHECLYCYANYNHELVRRNCAEHDPESALLFGSVRPNDRIHERRSVSCREIQEQLFRAGGLGKRGLGPKT